MLAALRRAGAPYELSPGRLLRETLVTSGTMTNRVDRLAARGLVERYPDPDDRRGVIVRLTAEGKATVDGAFEALLDAERELLADLPGRDRQRLAAPAAHAARAVRRPLTQRHVQVVSSSSSAASSHSDSSSSRSAASSSSSAPSSASRS